MGAAVTDLRRPALLSETDQATALEASRAVAPGCRAEVPSRSRPCPSAIGGSGRRSFCLRRGAAAYRHAGASRSGESCHGHPGTRRADNGAGG